jgi:hypothetical protein
VWEARLAESQEDEVLMETIPTINKKLEQLRLQLKNLKTPQERVRSATDKLKQLKSKEKTAEATVKERQASLEEAEQDLSDLRSSIHLASQDLSAAEEESEKEKLQEQFPEATTEAEALLAKLDCKPGMLEELAKLIAAKIGTPMDVSEEKASRPEGPKGGTPVKEQTKVGKDGGGQDAQEEEWVPTQVDSNVKRPLEGEQTPQSKRVPRSRSRDGVAQVAGTPGGSSAGSPPAN